MPEVFDWQHTANPHAVIQYVAQSLCRGRIVAFPNEAGYALTASGLIADAVRRLGDEQLTLAVRGAAEARDWLPDMTPLARRLTRRLWPGPVTLLVGGDVEQGLASRLNEDVRARLHFEGSLRLATPRHEALREVLRRVPGPLVFAALSESETTALRNADAIIADGAGEHAMPSTVVAVNGDAWEVVRTGVLSADNIRELTACLLVFVCTGNTCRSALAEALCKKRLADRLACGVDELPGRGFHVYSAGVSAAGGAPAAAEAETTARGYGADLSAHRSRPLTAELTARADYLVGMTQGHLRAVKDFFGPLNQEPRLLNPNGDIDDPIGREQAIYDQCAQQIWKHLESLVDEIAPAKSL